MYYLPFYLFILLNFEFILILEKNVNLVDFYNLYKYFIIIITFIWISQIDNHLIIMNLFFINLYESFFIKLFKFKYKNTFLKVTHLIIFLLLVLIFFEFFFFKKVGNHLVNEIIYLKSNNYFFKSYEYLYFKTSFIERTETFLSNIYFKNSYNFKKNLIERFNYNNINIYNYILINLSILVLNFLIFFNIFLKKKKNWITF